MKIIAISGPTVPTAVLRVKDGVDVEKEVAKFKAAYQGVYTTHREIRESDVPSDRTFRDAWRGDFTVDMPKAKEIHRERIRARRAVLFQKLDADWMKAMGQGDATTAAVVETTRQVLRDAPANPAIDAATTPDELKAAVPEVMRQF